MKHKASKTILAVSLALTLLLLPGLQASAEPGDSTPTPTPSTTAEHAVVQSKDEAVYATLSADGTVRSVYVVNQFEIGQAGVVKDYGGYSSVMNLSSTEQISLQGEQVLFYAPEGLFYYQGDLKTNALPWSIRVEYKLDGQFVDPDKLGGQSGFLEILIRTDQQDGLDAVFYDNYMLQVALTLDLERCTNIIAEDAAIASAGTNRIVTYSVMPKQNATLALSAVVEDFEMSGIQVSAVPLAMSTDLIQIDDMIQDFEALSNAIGDLDNGVGQLADGMSDLARGANDLVEGSDKFQQGLDDLDSGSAKLSQGSGAIQDALNQISASLQTAAGQINLDDLSQLPAGIQQVSAGLSEISGGLTALNENFKQAYLALDNAMASIPQTQLTPEQLDALFATADPEQTLTLNTLVSSYQAAQTAKGTYDQVKAAFDALDPAVTAMVGSLDQIIGTLDQMALQFESQMADLSAFDDLDALSSGIVSLADQYAAFNQGLAAYIDGVHSLSSGYTELNSGLAEFADGVHDAAGAVDELHSGTAELDQETESLPDDVRSEIEKIEAKFSGENFQPVSFMSEQNTPIGLVQFVLKFDDIKKPAEPAQPQDEAAQQTFWDRLVALFR